MDSTIRPLLAQLFDYAGLFPPAKLSMEDTVKNYAAYRNAGHAWMLGKIIVPLTRLHEFVEVAQPFGGEWSLSVIGQASWGSDLDTIREFNSRQSSACDIHIKSMERKFSLDETPPHNCQEIETYCEVDPTNTEALTVLASNRLMAKVRCGGLDKNAFPNDVVLAKFLNQCHQLSLPFKATAGLHHPLKMTRPATQDENADTVDMHGFLNLTVAACLLHSGKIPSSQIEAVLADRDINSFEFTPTQIQTNLNQSDLI